jgi:succinyl-diaminopimelate desuccinylase
MEDLLQKLVAYPSVTGDSQASHELIEFVAGFVAARGMHVQRYIYNGYESLVATTQPNDKNPTVILAAHADVVAAPEEAFVMRKEGDRIYGRGVLDMKFALAGYLKIIDELGEDLPNYSLGLMVTTDEEIGGRDGVPLLLKEGYRAKVFILPDGGENWQIQTASKGILVYKITAHGTSVHSSRHWEGDNAIRKLLPAIVELEALMPAEQGPATNSLSINKISAGRNLNQVPNKATMTVDTRTLNATEHERLRQAITAICERLGLEYELEVDGDPTYFDLADPYIATYVSLVEETTGITVKGTQTLGSNDTRFLAPLGIPCISFYPTGAGHHSADEWISVQALHDFHSVTRRYIEQVACTEVAQQQTAPTFQRLSWSQMARDLQRKLVRAR